jgi:D-galactarolactone cycloisomerase
MPQIDRIETFVYRAPIAVPVRTSFGTMADRAAVFVRVEDRDGAVGWGEVWCNFPSVGAEHRARLIHTLIAPLVRGRTVEDPARLWGELDARLHVMAVQSGEPGPLAAALAGVDIALHDLAARRAGLPLWRHLGGGEERTIDVYASGINPGAAAADIVAAKRAEGHRAFKVKLGFGETEDLATLRAVAAQLEANERLMVDINQGWDLPTARHMAGRLAEFPLRWIEEPLVADRPAEEWQALRSVMRTSLAGGENLRGRDVFDAAIRAGYFDVLQPDACKWGGISATLPVARAALAADRIYCPHYLGGAVGLMASLHLLAAAGGPGLLEVDANANPLREGLLDGLVTVHEGRVAVPRQPGLGIVPDLRPLRDLLVLHLECRS